MKPNQIQWSEPFTDKGLYVLSYKGGIAQRAASQQIAAFDLDQTLIRPCNNRRFPAGPHDWEWTGPRVKATLQNLHRQGCGLVIITNQARFTPTGSVKTRIECIVRDLDLPLIQILTTCTRNHQICLYRQSHGGTPSRRSDDMVLEAQLLLSFSIHSDHHFAKSLDLCLGEHRERYSVRSQKNRSILFYRRAYTRPAASSSYENANINTFRCPQGPSRCGSVPS
jgi:DNA 3'-phosphatase